MRLLQFRHDVLKTEIHQYTDADHHTIPTEQNWFYWKSSLSIKIVYPLNRTQNDRLLHWFYDLSSPWMQKTELSLLMRPLVNHQNWVQIHIWNHLNHVPGSYEIWPWYHKISYNVKVFLLSGYKNLSAELIDNLRLARSLNYYNEPGIYGAITRTSKLVLNVIKRPSNIIVIIFPLFIIIQFFYVL